ncbi:MAG: DUF2142 domain-containing protein [Brachyspira sp.]|nr:DUF2142 domain-containing protein [Brachyspira sp.]
MFLTPPYKVPDESSHLLRACEVADGIFYNKTPAQNVECDKYIQKQFSLIRPAEVYQVTGYPPVLYAFSALGLNAGKLWGGAVMFYLGRIFNLLMWIALIAVAIRITPVFKYQFLFAALLPMSVYVGMSLSADAFNNAFSFLFFAYLFKLIYDKKDLERQDYILLVLMSLLSAFTKGAIYPIFLFFFLPIKKYKYLFSISCLGLAFALMSWWAAINLPFYNPQASPELHRYLLLHNPFDFVLLYIKALIHNCFYYIRSCIGILGLLDVRFALPVYIITMLVFFSSFFFLPEKKVSNPQRILSLAVLFMFLTMLHCVLYITWTPAGTYKISGFQGRYLISILPFIFLIFAQNKDYVSEKFQKYYKIFLIIFIFLLLLYASWILLKTYHMRWVIHLLY